MTKSGPKSWMYQVYTQTTVKVVLSRWYWQITDYP